MKTTQSSQFYSTVKDYLQSWQHCRLGYWAFSIGLILQAAEGPGVGSACDRSEYKQNKNNNNKKLRGL
jgi:hypothetical protein